MPLEENMKLIILRNKIEIVPEDGGCPNYDERDTAFIENVLGLKKDGDSIKLVRRNAHGVNKLAYLETKRA